VTSALTALLTVPPPRRHGAGAKPISTIDGSTWDPFARRLLLTTESSNAPT
jgi:hypothetical protein